MQDTDDMIALSELRFAIATGRDMWDDADVIKVFFITKDEDHESFDNLFVQEQTEGLPDYIYDRDVTDSGMENYIEIVKTTGLTPEKVKQDLIDAGVEYFKGEYEFDDVDVIY